MSSRRKWDVAGEEVAKQQPPKSHQQQVDDDDQQQQLYLLYQMQQEDAKAGGRGASAMPPPIDMKVGSLGVLEKEIEINNCRNRYALTKGSTLQEIHNQTGASVVVKGRFYNTKLGEAPGIGEEKPLYLHISADNPESLHKAVARVEEIMAQQPTYHTEKLFIGIEDPDPGFNIPANIIGPKGAYVKHITSNCGGTRVQLKGKGSGYKDPETNAESEEAMHLLLTSNTKVNLEKAKNLAQSLLDKVRQEHSKFVENKKKKMSQMQNYYNNYYNPYAYYYQYYGYPPGSMPEGAPGSVASGAEPPPPGASADMPPGAAVPVPPVPGAPASTTLPPGIPPAPATTAQAATPEAGAQPPVDYSAYQQQYPYAYYGQYYQGYPQNPEQTTTASSTESKRKREDEEGGDASVEPESKRQRTEAAQDPQAQAYAYWQHYYQQMQQPPAPTDSHPK